MSKRADAAARKSATAMSSLSVGGLRSQLAHVVNSVIYTRRRVAITKYGRPVAVISPFEDEASIRRREDEIDVRAGDRVKRRLASRKDKSIPWEKAKKKLGW